MKPHPPIARHRAAIRRHELSRPVRLAIADGIISDATSVLDYGCGHGDDMRRLTAMGISCEGWDPAYRSHGARDPRQVVNMGYVLNVIEDPDERKEALTRAWRASERVLVVAARLSMESRYESQDAFGDGYLTRIGTFQKYYEQDELRGFLRDTLDIAPVAAGPGVFYCFRDPRERESFAAWRHRRRSSAPRVRRSEALFEAHEALLAPLMEFVRTRGRVPRDEELANAAQLIQELGSVRRAFSLVARVTGREPWHAIREACSEDLLIYLALAKFDGRPRFSDLPVDVQLDVRAFHSSYKRACERADALLFSVGEPQAIARACAQSEVGKKMPTSLYVHRSALSSLPGSLRVYEGCARAYIGTVERANIVKLHVARSAVSYLWYPDFERDPHPALAFSMYVDLRGPSVRRRDYRASKNPPILHRKEEFVGAEHPLRQKFSRLTRQEEDWGLYANPSEIGTRDGWNEVLARYGLRHRGHRLVRRRSDDVPDDVPDVVPG